MGSGRSGRGGKCRGHHSISKRIVVTIRPGSFHERKGVAAWQIREPVGAWGKNDGRDDACGIPSDNRRHLIRLRNLCAGASARAGCVVYTEPEKACGSGHIETQALYGGRL